MRKSNRDNSEGLTFTPLLLRIRSDLFRVTVATWTDARKVGKKRVGIARSSTPSTDVQERKRNDAFYYHSDAWLASNEWSVARPGDENMRYVDVLSDIVPFWLQEVAAAQRGEKLRYGQFLDNLQAGRRENLSAWGLPVPAWADGQSVDGSIIKNNSNSYHSNNSPGSFKALREDDATAKSVQAEVLSETSLDRDDFNFVEKVAILNGLNPLEKKEMRRFYKVRIVLLILEYGGTDSNSHLRMKK